MRFLAARTTAPSAATLRELYGALAPVAVVPPAGDVLVCPGRDTEVSAGDEVTLIGTPGELAAADIIDHPERIRRLTATAAPSPAPGSPGGLGVLGGDQPDDPRAGHGPADRAVRTLRDLAVSLARATDRRMAIALGALLAVLVTATLVLRFTYRYAGPGQATGSRCSTRRTSPSKSASAWKRRKIVTPSGETQLRVIRPKFREMLDDLATGRVNSVLCEDLDRTVRDPRDLEDFIDAMAACKGNARSASGSLKFTNGGTSDEITVARMLVTMASKSSSDTSRRVKDARERWWGKSYFGGKRPFGYAIAQETEEYRRTLIVIPDEATLITDAVTDILERDIALRAIARDWRESGIPTASGNGMWTADIVRRVISKPTVAGLQIHNGVTKSAPWEPILKQDVWERLTAKLSDPGRLTHSGVEPKWLLSKIATCGTCGESLVVTGSRPAKHAEQPGKRRAAQGPKYACPAGYHVQRSAPHSDAWVERNITAYISVHGATILKPEPRKEINADALRAEQKKIRERRAYQLELHGEGLITDGELKTRLHQFAERLTVIDAQLAKSDNPDPLPEFRHHGPTRKIWHDLPLARKRAIIRQLVDVKICTTTRRGAGFDADAVKITIKETGQSLDVRSWPAEAEAV
jgi:DNA invertase Pin-like site-specific DNA recombinase